MPKYKIVADESKAETKADTVVELRLVVLPGGPSVQARNPGAQWRTVASFKSSGKLSLGSNAQYVIGLKTGNYGEIQAY